VDEKGLKWVPDEYRDVMCSLFHATPFSFHYDAKRTLLLLTRIVTWPYVVDHVKSHVASCLTCRIVKGKVEKPVLQVRNVEPVPVPGSRSGPCRSISHNRSKETLHLSCG
jgi:hypothetical protein